MHVEPVQEANYEQALKQAETDKTITKVDALQHQEESGKESDKEEKKQEKEPKTLYLRKEYGDMSS